MKQKKIEYCRKDERGELIQVNTGRWRQLNILKLKKGFSFGGHYHKLKEELFYIIKGEIKISIKNDGGTHSLLLKSGDCFLVEPYDNHTLHALKDSIVVEALSKPYNSNDIHE